MQIYFRAPVRCALAWAGILDFELNFKLSSVSREKHHRWLESKIEEAYDGLILEPGHNAGRSRILLQYAD